MSLRTTRPLPPFNQTGLDVNLSDAYTDCRAAEEISITTGATALNTVCARLLGYLLLHPPSATACDAVVRQVRSCEHVYDRLYALGRTYINYFSRLCKLSTTNLVLQKVEPYIYI